MIYILPGMGADSAMYTGPWRELEESQFLDWPTYEGEIDLRQIANKLISENVINKSSTIIGSSLGGMVACEIANRAEVNKIILVGSAKNKKEINDFLSFIHPIVDFTPIKFIQRITGKYQQELLAMFSRSDPDFVRSMCRAIFDWDGLSSDFKRLYRIHGCSDRVIPLPGDTDCVIDGGHLIAVTHPEKCVSFVKKSLTNS